MPGLAPPLPAPRAAATTPVTVPPAAATRARSRQQPADPYAPLRLYDGAWRVHRSGASPDRLVNRCARVGRYFACEQTVNDTVRALVTFIPADAAGHYATGGVLPTGAAIGAGTLVIDGARWTYEGHETADGRTTYRRTTNQFTGADRIHFDVLRSDDGVHWTTTMSGDEERAGPAPAAAAGSPPA